MPALFTPDDISLQVREFEIPYDRCMPYSGILRQHFALITAYDEDHPECSRPIGYLKFAILDVGQALNERESLFDVCDSHSQSYYELWHSLYPKHDCLPRASVRSAIGGDVGGLGLLYLDQLYIAPRYRGNQLGLAAIETVLKRYSLGCGFAALKAFPYQDKDKPDTVFKRASRALRKHYGRLGFVRVGSSDYMALNLA